MMKRTLPLLLLLALACAAGCEPKKDATNTNANANANANTNSNANPGIRPADVNANVSVNANTGNNLHTKEDKSVAIHITEDSSGKLQIVVSPEDIRLSKTKNQRLRFHVFNNTEVEIKEVVITFVTVNPMDGDFKISDIKPGNENNSVTRKIRGDAAAGSYTYGLKAFGYTGTEPVAVMNSPEVEIAT